MSNLGRDINRKSLSPTGAMLTMIILAVVPPNMFEYATGASADDARAAVSSTLSASIGDEEVFRIHGFAAAIALNPGPAAIGFMSALIAYAVSLMDPTPLDKNGYAHGLNVVSKRRGFFAPSISFASASFGGVPDRTAFALSTAVAISPDVWLAGAVGKSIVTGIPDFLGLMGGVEPTDGEVTITKDVSGRLSAVASNLIAQHRENNLAQSVLALTTSAA